jgi:hypothetical protein
MGTDDGLGAALELRDLSSVGRPFGSTSGTGVGGFGGNLGVCGKIVLV